MTSTVALTVLKGDLYCGSNSVVAVLEAQAGLFGGYGGYTGWLRCVVGGPEGYNYY